MRRPAARLLLALAAFAMIAAPASADAILEQARKDFLTLCAPCHGEAGKGDGHQAPHLKTRPADLTAIAARYGEFPEDRMFETISGLAMTDGHGTRDMPVWGDVFVSENIGESTKLDDALKATDDAIRRIAGLVLYLESIQASP